MRQQKNFENCLVGRSAESVSLSNNGSLRLAVQLFAFSINCQLDNYLAGSQLDVAIRLSITEVNRLIDIFDDTYSFELGLEFIFAFATNQEISDAILAAVQLVIAEFTVQHIVSGVSREFVVAAVSLEDNMIDVTVSRDDLRASL